MIGHLIEMTARQIAPREWIDCERFLNSWQRFQENKAGEEEKKSLGIVHKQVNFSLRSFHLIYDESTTFCRSLLNLLRIS